MTLELTLESKPIETPIEAETEGSSLFSEEEKRGFARRVFDVCQGTMPNNDRLSVLSQIDPEKFEEERELAVDEYLNNDPDYLEFFGRLKEARRYSPSGGDSFKAEMRARRSNARDLITKSLHLPEDTTLNGIDEAKNHIADLLKDTPKEPENLNSALITLGVKTKVDDDSGEYIYSYPYDLMPDKINNKWADYLESVKVQTAAIDKVTAFSGATEDSIRAAETLNDARQLAHTIVTGDIHYILQLDQFGLDEKQTRGVVAKMRNDELNLDRKPHKSIHHKTPEEIAVAKQLARRRYDH